MERSWKLFNTAIFYPNLKKFCIHRSLWQTREHIKFQQSCKAIRQNFQKSLFQLLYFCVSQYSLVLNTSHGVFPENCDQANFCMDITLLIPNRSWWDYKEHFQLALIGYTINIIMIDKEMTELWHLKVCRVSYSSVSCIRDQRVVVRVSDIYIDPPKFANRKWPLVC